MNTLQKFEAKQLEKAQASKQIPDFAPGDTVKVNVKISEGGRERIQAYEGVCISRPAVARTKALQSAKSAMAKALSVFSRSGAPY